MGIRKVIVKQSAAEGIAAIAWFIESKGMIATADKFTDDIPTLLHKACRQQEIISPLQRTGPGIVGL